MIPKESTVQTVCVFCGSSTGRGETYVSHARILGKALLSMNCNLVYGGSNIGLMRILADTVLDGGGKVTGVMPNGLADKEIAHNCLHHLHLVNTMHERKAMMAEFSDGFIAMPGGLGTLDELFEILSWNQLDIITKPVALYNVDGYFNYLIKFLDHTVTENFVRPEHRANLLIDDDAQRLIIKMKNYTPLKPHSKWVDELRVTTNKHL